MSRAAVTPADAAAGPPLRRAAAWGVHLYTALGAVVAVVGIDLAASADARGAFVAMYVATVIDSTDGWLARLAEVKRFTPRFDGARLDDIVDYLTFTVLPAYAVLAFGLVPPGWAIPVAAAMLLSSAYGFAAADAKTPDHFFTGFPSYWNIVVFYLYAGGVPRRLSALVLLACAALVFVRIGYVYPSRTPVLRSLTIGLGVVWGVLLLEVLRRLPDRSPGLLLVSLGFPVYYVVLSLVLHRRRAGARRT
ncbi:MAG TPA: hypothetical protein VNI83_02975 [Vicinamibacterales bacterium]|nr:hypothetical protein [Vicinamibacterales bacterium]